MVHRRQQHSATHGTAVRVGCAGWSIPREVADLFPEGDSHLARYASRLPAVEINSSFYRPHRPATYQRWAAAVPPAFRFSVKVPKLLTHERRLAADPEMLQSFLLEVTALGDRLGCLLLQLPPSLRFDVLLASQFFKMLREQSAVPVACEPRHVTWFSPQADKIMKEFDIARVGADPPCLPIAAVPSDWNHVAYFRLHGSPRMYYSSYDATFQLALVKTIRAALAAGQECWCIFDNTAAGAAIPNALSVLDALLKSRTE